MHLPHDRHHLVHRLGRRLDHEIDALVEHVQVTVGYQAGDLDKGISGEVKPGHLTVDPDEPVSHPPRLEPYPGNLVHVLHLASRRPHPVPASAVAGRSAAGPGPAVLTGRAISSSLVSCPIALYTASSSSERVSFRQINKKTGNRLRQQLVDEVTREPIESDDKGRGYEYAKGAYILVDDDELDAVAIESNHTIEIDTFVPRTQIDERYLESPYYIIPNDKVGQEAFAVIREAMRGKGMVALARIVLAKRERVIMLQPWDKGIDGDDAALSV